MIIYAVDPGPEQSCLVVFNAPLGKIERAEDLVNADLEKTLDSYRVDPDGVLVIEQVKSFGKPVGEPVFETVFFSGRISKIWGGTEGNHWFRLPRSKVAHTLIGTSREVAAGAVRQRLIDLIGPQGVKKHPGPTYGISKHKWEALALAVAFAIRQNLLSPEMTEKAI